MISTFHTLRILILQSEYPIPIDRAKKIRTGSTQQNSETHKHRVFKNHKMNYESSRQFNEHHFPLPTFPPQTIPHLPNQSQQQSKTLTTPFPNEMLSGLDLDLDLKRCRLRNRHGEEQARRLHAETEESSGPMGPR